MGLDNGTRAVGEVRGGGQFAREEEILLGLLLVGAARRVHCVFDGVSTERSTDTFWSVQLRLHGIWWSNHCIPLGDGVIADKGQASDHITLEEVNIFGGRSTDFGKD